MIYIQIPGNHTPERSYIIDLLLGEFLGLDYQICINTNIRDYIINVDDGCELIIKDHFFKYYGDGLSYLNKENIPNMVEFASNQFIVNADIPVLYGNNQFEIYTNKIVCGIDIFASSFFMLTRWEEFVCKNLDHFGRFPIFESLSYKYNFLDRPIVNEYVEMLWNMLKHLKTKQRRQERKFELVLTHDVDSVKYWRNIMFFLKIIAGDLLRTNPTLLAHNINNYISAKLGLKNDPYDTFDFLMDISDAINTKSSFFIMACKPTAFDCGYSVFGKNCLSLIKKINERGHFIGIHSSFFAYNDPIIWKNEYRMLSKYSPQIIASGRQHCLRFEVPITWQIMDDNKMEWDSTLGYANKEGFRCGVCYDFSVFNILTRQKLKLKEKPLVAMDVSFLYQGLSPKSLKQKILCLMDRVKKYQGTFVLLWHNSSFNVKGWEKYSGIYENLLKEGVEVKHE